MNRSAVAVRWWMLTAVVCALVGGTFVNMALLQEETPSVEYPIAITDAPTATVLPTEIVLPTDEPTSEPDTMEPLATITSLPTLTSAPTQTASLSPTLTPTVTDVIEPTSEATDEPVLPETTLLPTEQPAEDSPVQTDENPEQVPATVTQIVLPEPTISPSESPQLPIHVVVMPSAAQLPVNDRLSLTFWMEGAVDVWRVAAACGVDPLMLAGQSVVSGDIALPDQFVIDESGFQEDGRWLIVGTTPPEILGLSGAGVLWQLDYRMMGEGQAHIQCQVQVTDVDGNLLPLVADIHDLTVEGYLDSVDEASPIVEFTTTPTPTLELPTVTPEVLLFGLSGQVQALSAPEPVIVRVTNGDAQYALTLDQDGNFSVALPPGTYQLIVRAPQHVTQAFEVIVVDQPIALQPVMLAGGDVDGNGVVDHNDAVYITQNFGRSVPAANPAADLNSDGMVDIYDLAIVSAGISQ